MKTPSRLLTRRAFGVAAYPANPQDHDARHETADATRISDLIDEAVKTNAMVAICGARGTGKTWAVHAAIPANAHVVTVERLDKEKVHMGDIATAIIEDLAPDESMGRSAEVRDRKLRRIIGTAAKTAKVVLVIEEAHKVHHSTLRALKRLRELTWMGQSQLLSIILVGQSNPFDKPSMEEVAKRSDALLLEGLTADEATTYIERHAGHVFHPDAIHALAETPKARNWLDLQEAVDHCLAAAMAGGRDTVTLVDVATATGGGLRAMLDSTGISQAAAAAELKISTTDLSRHLNGERDNPETQRRITEFLMEKMGGGNHPARKVA
ncbi:AAA family ATPase [Endothiovibrio diazotrophicus]